MNGNNDFLPLRKKVVLGQSPVPTIWAYRIVYQMKTGCLIMGFDQKAMTLVGKDVEVKMFNGVIISGTMTHVSKGYVCFVLGKRENDTNKKKEIRRLSIRDITSMVAIN
ncbi:hypothetical protein [Brevibacillus laterosporus]